MMNVFYLKFDLSDLRRAGIRILLKTLPIVSCLI